MTDTQASMSQPFEGEVQGRLKDLEEENELLLLQLHQVQEELEYIRETWKDFTPGENIKGVYGI